MDVDAKVAAVAAKLPDLSGSIHPSSIIHPTAQLARDVEIGPFCTIGPGVSIGEGTRLISNVVVMSSTTIGRRCTIWPGSVIGGRPQVYQDNPDGGSLLIKDDVTIREGVTINLSVMGRDKPTTIGNNCLLMANVHVAHDCQLSDRVTLVQGVGLAGHCQIHQDVTIGGLAGLHQHVVVGQGAFVGGGALVTYDVAPYSIATGNRAKTKGLNVVGLQRKGWSSERIRNLQATMTELFMTGTTTRKDEDAQLLLSFWKNSKRGVSAPAQKLARL